MISRKNSASISRARSIASENDTLWDDDDESGFTQMIFSKKGFLNFYTKASCGRPNNVMEDIVFQEMAYKLINNKGLSVLLESNTNDNDIDLKLLQLKHSFVEYLKNKFVSNEKILIVSMMKKANMFKNKFDKMNDDVLNLILKYLHPLNLNEKNYQLSIIDETICQQSKYEMAVALYKKTVERKWLALKYPKFYNITKQRLMEKMTLAKQESNDCSTPQFVSSSQVIEDQIDDIMTQFYDIKFDTHSLRRCMYDPVRLFLM